MHDRHDRLALLSGAREHAPVNAQISTFGMGKLLIQVFICPILQLIDDYRIAARTAGLVQVWPAPTRWWPFDKGAAKFPTKLILDDEEVDSLGQSFGKRIALRPPDEDF
ncbi:MAG: hypothetical protein H0X27_12505 [Caulobacteraceae bacterium]|nr:hypothetical protein [Caulobacteraceae bacterium]